MQRKRKFESDCQEIQSNKKQKFDHSPLVYTKKNNFSPLSKQELNKLTDDFNNFHNNYQLSFLNQLNHSTPLAEDKLQNKFKDALLFIKRTVAYGSSNKIADIIKTNGRVRTQKLRYEIDGFFIKLNENDNHDSTIMELNEYFTQESMDFDIQLKNDNWYYSGDEQKTMSLNTRFPGVDPLNDIQFNLNERAQLLTLALHSMETKQANCEEKSCLVAKYLWENNKGIDTIEIVSMQTIDHFFVIVNRQGSLNDSSTWGDKAWIIDAWYGDTGIIFPANQFVDKINDIKRYYIQEANALKNIGISTENVSFSENETLTCMYKIIVNKHAYPTYSHSTSPNSVFYPIEYYYAVDCTLSNEELKQASEHHKVDFNNCLNDIKSLQGKHPSDIKFNKKS